MKLSNLLLITILSLSSCKVAPIIEPITDEVCDDFEPFYETTDSSSIVLEIKCPCEMETFDLSTKLVPYAAVQSLIYECNETQFNQIPTMPSVTNLSSKIMTGNIRAFPNLEVFRNNGIMETPIAYELISMPNLKEISLFNVTQFPDVLGTRPLEEFKITYENSASYNISVPNNLYQLANLKELSLNNLNVTDFSNWGNLSSLENLKVINTPIIRFPNTANQWTKMKTFELSKVTMRGGRPNFFQYADSLETIYLSEMEVSDNLQENIYNAPNLKSLSFSFCEMTSIPETIGKLTSLENLIITTDENQIMSFNLPMSLSNLIHLKSIVIRTNTNSFPTAILGLTNSLEAITITDEINSVPATIGDFNILKTLKLTNCNLSTLPIEIQNLADTLERLYLAGNNFSDVKKQEIQTLLPNTSIYF